MTSDKTLHRIASELLLSNNQVSAIAALLSGGATIPFIACYRKDATGGIGAPVLEQVADALKQEQDLEQRKRSLLDSLSKQDRLTEGVRHQIETCEDRFELEDLGAGMRKPRNTKAAIAIEKGLQPLADYLFHQALLNQTIPLFAESFVSAQKQVSSLEEALEGAQHILADRIAGSADARGIIRSHLIGEGKLTAHATKNAEGKKTKYEAYYKFSEPVLKVSAYKFFGLHRGAEEGVLRVELEVNDSHMIDALASRFIKEAGSPFEPVLRAAISDAYNRTLRPTMEKEVMNYLRRRAEDESLALLRENAKDLLLSPYAEETPVLGIDPGGKSIWKAAAIGAAGNLIESASISTAGDEAANAGSALLSLLDKHGIRIIAIGHGGNGREIQSKIRDFLRDANRKDVQTVIVNDAGASAYANSKPAKDEFPDADTGVRIAVSVARRFQDPLSELVKMDSRHIGFGQFHHEVSQGRLRQGIERTITSVVSSVGVDLNRASADLLSWVSGLNGATGRAIVKKREELGRFSSREQLKQVDGLSAKAFEQCAGFLRIIGGDNLLDTRMIHPELYGIAQKIVDELGVPLSELGTQAERLKSLDLTGYESETSGKLCIEQLRNELLHPSRDPRARFRSPRYADGIAAVSDLRVALETEGIVSNVTDFGAFVDIGVEQDGLVHVSQIPAKDGDAGRIRLKVGDLVRVRVVKVDKETPRISLTMRFPSKPKDRPRPQPRKPESGEVASPVTAESEPRKPQPEKRRERPQGPRDQQERRPRPKPAGVANDGNGRERERDRGPRRDARKDKHKSHSDQPMIQVSGKDDGLPLNTLLADQLAALRNKLQSGS
jgi:uncharacterized protein